MQSAVPHVLATLDRVHSPGRPAQAVADARAAGFAQVSLDLIYGTPGESVGRLGDQPGRRAGRRARPRQRVRPDRRARHPAGRPGPPGRAADDRRGRPGRQVPARRGPADRRRPHRVRGQQLGRPARPPAAGTTWPTGAATTGGAIGPGAHSHVGGVRWWNVKHPSAYADRLAAGRSPAYAREVLTAEERRTERVLLELRLADGLPLDVLTPTEARRVPDVVARGLAEVRRRPADPDAAGPAAGRRGGPRPAGLSRAGVGVVLGDEVEQLLHGGQQRPLQVVPRLAPGRGSPARRRRCRPGRGAASPARRRCRASSRSRAGSAARRAARAGRASPPARCRCRGGRAPTRSRRRTAAAPRRRSATPCCPAPGGRPARRADARAPGRSRRRWRGRSSTPPRYSTTTPTWRRSSPQIFSTSSASCRPST